MPYKHANTEKSRPLTVVFNIVLALALALFIISAAVVFTLNFRPLYYFELPYARHERERPYSF